MNSEIKNKLSKGLIVSCQALEDEPLHSSYIMSRMAVAAVQEGAVGIRANSVEDITAIKKEVDVPVIGIIKAEYPDSEVYITPTMKEMRALCETGAEIIATDATLRNRPHGDSLKEIISTIKEEFPDILLMADTSSIEDVKYACKIGFDFIGTTLHGYTEQTKDYNIADDDFSYLKEVLKISTKPVIAEGKIDSPEKARRVLELGSFCVVVGSAITRPQVITKGYIDAINLLKNESV